MVDESTGLENELLSDEVEVEETSLDDAAECTNDYFSNAYGQQYCVGDTIETADGPMTVTSIWEGQAVTSVYGGDLDADELYPEMGAAMGMSEEQFASFIDSYNELKREAAALDTSHHVLGPTEMERGRLGVRIRQANPDWTEEQINAEVDRLLDPKTRTAEQYADLARREAELFEQYGMQSQNHATFGQGIWVGPDGKYYKFTGSNGHWQQTSQDDGFLDFVVPIGIAIGAAAITGGGLGSLGGFWGTTAGSMTSGAIGSAVSQGALTGSIDPKAMLTAALMAGIGSLAEQLRNMDSAIMDGGVLGTADDIVNAASEMLNIPYDQALEILEGVANGAVSGGDIESIVGGVVGNLTSNQIQDWLTEAYGETINVDDWFKDGESHIPVTALEPIIDQVVNGIINGDIDDPGAWARTIWDYFQAGGDIDFMLPDGINLGDFFGGMGDFQCEDWMPEWMCGGLGDLPNPCEDWEMLEGICDAKIGCINSGGEWDSSISDCVGSYIPDIEIGMPCEEGGKTGIWALDALGEAICNIEVDIEIPELPEIGTPCSVDGEQGIWGLTELDEFVCEVDIKIETPYDCSERGEGWTWDNLVGDCVPPITVDPICNAGSWDEVFEACLCSDGSPENPDGTCPDIKIETPYDCSERGAGWTWDNLVGDCIPPAPDGPDWNPGDPCSDEEGNEGFLNEAGVCELPDIDIPNPCEEQGGWLDEMGVCQFPEVDINMPQFNNTTYDMGPRASLYEYDPFVASETPGPREFEQYLSEARGLLDL